MKNIARSGLSIIIVTNLVEVNEAYQHILTLTILDTKMSGTLEIGDNSFDCFLVAFFGVLHKPRNHTNNKGNVKLTMSKINKISNQLSIKCSINFGCLKSFGELFSILKRSITRLTINHIKTCQNIHHIF
jgi:hypothetical protein